LFTKIEKLNHHHRSHRILHRRSSILHHNSIHRHSSIHRRSPLRIHLHCSLKR
jgi:hypothetical protein